YIMQSQEHISETTQNVYKKYFMSLAESLFVEVNEEKLEVLFSKLTASEYLLNKIEKPHSDTIYYFNEICCYSYFMAGSSKIRFETLTNEQKDEYHLNGISCIDINNMD
ncbi:MAG: hypothetical protein RSA27_03400, partial [Oscillospiraceae bacterium]